jgi:hypothetical protein
MAQLKTQKTKASVKAFMDAIEDPQRRMDARAVAKIMRQVTGRRAAMWGEHIVGFGSYAYGYKSGRTGEWPRVSFSPGSRDLSVYIMPGFSNYKALLRRLGKHSIGKSCLRIKKLEDIDLDVLTQLIEASVAAMAEEYPE